MGRREVSNGGGGKLKDMYERLPGTAIKMIDGTPSRVVNVTGKIFQPNDLQGARSHLDKLASENGRGGSKANIKGGGKGKKGRALMALPASGKMQVKKKIVKDGGKGKPKERGGRRKGKFLDRVVKSRKEKKEMTPEQKEK